MGDLDASAVEVVRSQQNRCVRHPPPPGAGVAWACRRRLVLQQDLQIVLLNNAFAEAIASAEETVGGSIAAGYEETVVGVSEVSVGGEKEETLEDGVAILLCPVLHDAAAVAALRVLLQQQGVH